MGKLLTLLLFVVATTVGTSAFLHSSISALGKSKGNDYAKINAAFPFLSSSTNLGLSSSSNGDDYDSIRFPKSRTDVRNFLTQRSIQSFVFLLNQCREEHTVRFLEKILDFPSIDNFHGTGAFNLTKFPEWDSIFLDCVDRPEEVIVIQIRQRRRQRKLSGHNAYFESLKSTTSEDKTKADGTAKFSTTKKTFSTANYLGSINSVIPSSSSTKVSRTSKITGKRLSGTSNYLDNLSSKSVSPSKSLKVPLKDDPKKLNKKGPTFTDDEKPNPLLVNQSEKTDKKGNENLSDNQNQQQKPIQRTAFSSGKSTNYLESLSAKVGKNDGRGKKIQQSTEISKNPFLDEKTNEVQLSIDPPALVRRILSVREQLSKEWVEDLDILLKVNDEIIDYFEEHINEVTNKEEDRDDCAEEDNQKINNAGNDAGDKSFSKDSNDLDLLLKALVTALERKPPPPFPLDSSYNATLKANAKYSHPDEEKREKIFDGNIFNTWSQLLWNPKRSSSPYRKANFDLLLLLATQESIHRVFNSYIKDDAIRPETQGWLLDFYTDNVNEYFDGHQTHARSEDFLQEMLRSPRTLIETNNDVLAWVDPAIVAEDILRERSDVILEWIKVAETILDEHTDLRRLLFANMISKSIPDQTLSDTILEAVKKENKVDCSSQTEIFGAFE